MSENANFAHSLLVAKKWEEEEEEEEEEMLLLACESGNEWSQKVALTSSKEVN